MHLRSLDYHDRPNYLFIYQQLTAKMRAIGARHSDRFAWEMTPLATALKLATRAFRSEY